MKKVLSLVLVVALFAALAVCASADVVTHSCWCAWDNFWYETLALAQLDIPNTVFAVEANELVDSVKIVDITEGAKQTFTSCAQAITADELQAVCDADERISNLTVFRQRNIEEAEGAVDISVKLWPCNPEKKPNQATVILFRAEGTEEWVVAAYEASSEASATLAGTSTPSDASAPLTGNGAYVVALAW